MKKFYLLVVLFLSFSMSAYTQNTVYTFKEGINEITLDASGVWQPANPWTINPQNGTGTLVIPTGKKLILYRTLNFSGRVEVYGDIDFVFSTGSGGTLALSSSSQLILASGSGKLFSSGNGNNHNNHNFIMIGTSQISGSQINNFGDGPRYFSSSNLTSGGCPTPHPQSCNFMPLPVDLLYFRATTQQQGVQLTWASAKEWSFSHYTVERSADGKEFSPIHTEYVQGESSTTKKYAYLDVSPLHGANYYRLKATDIDGTVEYKGVTMAYTGTKGDLVVMPNPAKGSAVTIKYLGAKEGAVLSIYNGTGVEIKRITLSDSELRLPAGMLTPGIYQLKVNNGLETKHTKLVISE